MVVVRNNEDIVSIDVLNNISNMDEMGVMGVSPIFLLW